MNGRKRWAGSSLVFSPHPAGRKGEDGKGSTTHDRGDGRQACRDERRVTCRDGDGEGEAPSGEQCREVEERH
jgi:hypothetical protein